MLACISCVKQEEGGGHGARDSGDDAPTTCRDPVKSLTTQLKDMVLKLSGTHRQQGGGGGVGGPRRRGGSPPPRTTSLYRSGYYRPGVVQDDMAVPPATYLGHGGGASSTASSTPAWERPPGNGESAAAAARGEWVAQVDPGVQITFVSLSGGTGGGGAGAGGGNDLKRIRFSREMYDKWQAQRWWAENNERIMELYNVRRFSRQDHVLPPSSDAGDAEQRESFYSQMGSTRASSPAATPSPAPGESATWAAAFARAAPPPSAVAAAARQHSFRSPLSPPPPSSSNPSERAWQKQNHQNESDAGGGVEPARTTTSSCRDDDVSISNASELEVTEWVIQDQPGVYITVRELADGARELRRVRFSREKFAELNAKLWWEENKERIHAQYL